MTQSQPKQARLSSTVRDENKPNSHNENPRLEHPKAIWMVLVIGSFIVGSLGGYYVGINSHSTMIGESSADNSVELGIIHPPEGYRTNARFGDIGPKLVAAGAFNLEKFLAVYEKAGQPLTQEQINLLRSGSDGFVVFTQQNAYFLLNLFWALGLTNQNPILESGPIMDGGREKVGRFASTGGWSLAIGPVETLYSSARIVSLTAAQQSRLEEVVIAVYRPCCDNPTHFPDCNHGMAMLGLLELMASQGAGVDEMFEAAKYANAYWFPSETLELAAYFQAKQNVSFADIDARQIVSKSFSSISGYQNVNQWLTTNGLLPQSPGGGNSCGV